MEWYELQKLATVYKTVQCSHDLSGFVIFSYKKVLRVKRTILVRGSWTMVNQVGLYGPVWI